MKGSYMLTTIFGWFPPPVSFRALAIKRRYNINIDNHCVKLHYTLYDLL